MVESLLWRNWRRVANGDTSVSLGNSDTSVSPGNGGASAPLVVFCAAGFYNAFMSFEEWEYLEGKRLPWPVDWPALFGREAPLLLEIGFGNGQFLLDLARRQPGSNVVGLEIAQPSLRNAQRKLTRRGCENVRLVHAKAEQALWTLFRAGALDAVYINFPDPWPKAGHESRRLISPQFLDLLASRMTVGATLDIATDVAAYATTVVDYLQACAYFDSRLADPFVADDESRIRTKYERIAMAEGRERYYFLWRRNGAPGPDRFPIPREYEMPHITLENCPPLAELAASFEPLTQSDEHGVVRYIDVFLAERRSALLIDTFIEEPALTQRIALHVRVRGNGSVVVGVHELGYPRATPGVHRAIQQLVDLLAAKYPQITVTSTNLVV